MHPDLIAALGENVLCRQGVLGLNLSYRPHAGPVRKGQHGVEKAKLRAEAQGKEIIGEEVSFDTTKGRRRVDRLTKDQEGQVEAVEVKTGKSRYTRRQQDKDHALDSEGGLPIGENARKEASLLRNVSTPFWIRLVIETSCPTGLSTWRGDLL